jgi:hypothetical protein
VLDAEVEPGRSAIRPGKAATPTLPVLGSRAEPKVRIHSPPAASPQTLGPLGFMEMFELAPRDRGLDPRGAISGVGEHYVTLGW